MVFNHKYKLSYCIDKECNELIIEVNLLKVEGPLAPRQNVYYGELKINDKINKDYDLSHCINAQFAAEDIGEEIKEKLKEKAKSDGKRIKFNKSELK